ncbi:hypothetical protein JR316_0002833 [Psilocybe cubensis]|uniref:Uncharacterized protein n=1 Tax=Psilocybe cubensis TaxID=181762 RepID=A0ACB8HDB1_PSICU|nr:hypothetical protein JR316_0002833 [Psilocybe cubensis]KAH9485916.1 hypothetical protein JR316_0002833 [Psilocybe cubensis]
MSSRTRKKFRAATFHCSYNGCIKTSTTSWGIQQHYNRKHVIPAALNTQPAIPRSPTDIPPSSRSPSPSLQPWSNTFSPRRSPRRTPSGSPKSYPNSANPVPKSNTRRPCDLAGNYLPPNTKPPPVEPHNKNDFTPFATRTEFEMAEFLFVEEEMSAGRIDRLSQLLGANYPDQDPPFANHSDLYACIDSIKQGDIPWTSFSVTYNGKIPEDGPVPEWMMQKYEVWFRNPLHVLEQQIGNPTYNKIAQDIKCHGSMFCPATSITKCDELTRMPSHWLDFLLFLEIIRSRHCLHALFKDGAQGKCTSHPDDLDAPSPRRSQMHTKALVDGCTLIELWDDYGIVGDLFPFTTSFPRADIHELLAPDLLHQIIKGTFKDHLVDWVTQYINQHHEPPTAKKILADIDQRYTFLAGLKKTFDG